MNLGSFILATDARRAKSAAVFSAALALCAVLGAAFALKHWPLATFSPLAAIAVYLLDRNRRIKNTVRGEILLDEGVLMLRRKDVTFHKVPLADAKISGRTLRVGPDQWARVQVVVEHGDRAIVAKLEVPFQPGPIDTEGPMKHTIELDRIGSRTFDALNDLKKRSTT
jgi:hypothetical protein